MKTQLDIVRAQTAKVTAARQRQEIDIREAREQGYPLRKIADAAGMSYETVRRICSE